MKKNKHVSKQLLSPQSKSSFSLQRHNKPTDVVLYNG